MLETSIIHSNLQSFYAQKPPVVFPDDSDDEPSLAASRVGAPIPTIRIDGRQAPAMTG